MGDRFVGPTLQPLVVRTRRSGVSDNWAGFISSILNRNPEHGGAYRRSRITLLTNRLRIKMGRVMPLLSFNPTRVHLRG
jgi:hypothetical protein